MKHDSKDSIAPTSGRRSIGALYVVLIGLILELAVLAVSVS